jgi:hypothetical protein
MRDRKVKQVLSGGWYQWEKEGYEERVYEGEYGRNIMCSCMKREKFWNYSKNWGGRKGE